MAAFTLNGTDADHDTLVWDLAFGDGNSTNGTTLPAMINHTYIGNHTGNLTASFTLTDGKDPTTYNVTVQSVAGAGGAATQDVDAAWGKSYNPACANSAVPYDAAPDTFAESAVEAGTIGQPFTATFDSGAAQDHIRFVDATGKSLLDVTTGLPSDADWIATGMVPDGAATVAFFGCGGTPGEHVLYHAG
jgi:hypothetical protein